MPGHFRDYKSQKALRSRCYLVCIKWDDQSLKASERWRYLHSSPTSGEPRAADYHSHKASRMTRPATISRLQQEQETTRDFTSRQAVRPEGAGFYFPVGSRRLAPRCLVWDVSAEVGAGD